MGHGRRPPPPVRRSPTRSTLDSCSLTAVGLLLFWPIMIPWLLWRARKDVP
jgi:hypothetical protein